MSVYHYCLEKRTKRDLKTGTFAFLIRDVLPHTPEVIKSLLSEASNLDDLLAKVVGKTVNKLTKWHKDLPTLKGGKLQEVLAKLSVPDYRTEKKADVRKDGKYIDSFPIPFDVHPMLVVRGFYPNQLTEKHTSISRSLWSNPNNRKGLISTHYNYENYFKIIGTFGAEEKKIKKYVIGSINALKTQDILLWKIAKEYLRATSAAYQTFIKGDGKEDDWKVGNLRNTVFKVPFQDFVMNGRNLGKVTLSIKFHQMDDFLLVESKQIMENALKQVLMRYEDPHQAKTIHEVEKDAKGFYTVAYQEVFKEIQRVYNDALHWAWFLLRWEKKVVDALTPEQVKVFADEKTAKGYKTFIDFNDVCSTQSLSPELLINLKNKLRNKTFHAEIPDGWAYWQMEREIEYQDLRNLLDYQKKLKTDYSK